MIREFAHFLRMAYPILLAFVLLLFNFQIGALGELHPTLRIPLYVTELELTLSSAWSTRIAINVLACIFLLLPAFRDYSAFFCGRYEMDVFYDDAGIDDILRTLTPKELDDTNITPAWKEDKIGELAHLNSIIETRFPGSEFKFSGRPGDLHSSGSVEFMVRKVRGAWQTYHIESAIGHLVHYFQIPGGQEQEFRTEFRLLETGTSYVRLSLLDIYIRFTSVIRSEFKQEVRVSATEVLYSGSVIGVTKSRVFPVLVIGNTIYLVRRESDGKLIPIAYAKYRAK